MNTSKLLFTTVLFFAAAGCSTHTIRTSDATEGNINRLGEKARIGNFYFLPRVLLRVSGHYIDDKKTAYQLSVSRLVQADPTPRLFAEYKASALADDTVSFVVNSKGLLDGAFTTESSDRTGAIVESLASTAINLWKIASYGALTGVPAKSFSSAAEEPYPLEPFDEIFDPFSLKAIRGFQIAGFMIRVSAIAGTPAYDAKNVVDVSVRTEHSGSRDGLIFRAPTIVELTIDHEAQFHQKPASSPSPTTGKAVAVEGGGTSDLGKPTAPTISNDQKSNDILSVTYPNADSSLEANLVVAAKAADPRPGAAVPFSFSRAAFVKKGTALAFVDGELLGIDILKPSELLAFVQVPENVTKSVLDAIPEIIRIRNESATRDRSLGHQNVDNEAARLTSQTALIDAQKANLQSQIELLAKQKELEAARTSTATPTPTPPP